MSEPQQKPEPQETPGERRERHRAVLVGIVVGGVIGVTLGLTVVSAYRGCNGEKTPPVEPPIKALPPRPAARPTG